VQGGEVSNPKQKTYEDWYKLFDERCAQLRKEHPRSQHTEDFVEKIRSLMDGDLDELKWTQMYVRTGPQWGIDFVERLMRDGLILKTKKDRKSFIELALPKEMTAGPFHDKRGKRTGRKFGF